MQVNHIIWKYSDPCEKSRGILEITVYQHGGGSMTWILEGVYDPEGRGSFYNVGLGIRIDENTLGVSGVSCSRVGTIVE